MNMPLQDLWDEVMPPEIPCPAPRPKAVVQRVNAALDAVPSERKRHMRQKWKTAAILATAVLTLTGSALAVARHWTVLDAFFGGSSQTGQTLMDSRCYSVEDDNYVLTVSSSMADTSTVYLLVTVEGKTSDGVNTLMSDDFEGIDTWSAYFYAEGEKEASPVFTFSTSEEKTLRTDTSRTWGMALQPGNDTPETVSIRLGVMEKGLRLEVPVTPAPSVTVTMQAEGNGAGTLGHAAGGPVVLNSVTLTPLGVTLDYAYSTATGESRPVPAFLSTDGTLSSWSQLVSMYGSEHPVPDPEGQQVAVSAEYPFLAVQDLSQLEAVVFEEIAYPLDGGAPYPVDVSSLPDPFFQLPLLSALGENSGYSVPVRALCDALGIPCTWDAASRSATMTFRGTTIVLTEGEKTALVNGETVDLPTAPDILQGKLATDCDIFAQTWRMDWCAAIEDLSDGLSDRVAWIVIP